MRQLVFLTKMALAGLLMGDIGAGSDRYDRGCNLGFADGDTDVLDREDQGDQGAKYERISGEELFGDIQLSG